MSDAKNQAKAQLESIVAMVAALEVDYDRLEELKEERCQLELERRDAYNARQLALTSGDVTAAVAGTNEECCAYEQLQKWDAENSDELAELVKAAGDCESREDAEQAIRDDPLSVEVRSGWAESASNFEPEEFRIVLCTGGPHVEIRGDIGSHGEPQDVKVFYADWAEKGEYDLSNEECEAVTEFCQQFYFG